MPTDLSVVITTIQRPTPSMRALSRRLAEFGVGDGAGAGAGVRAIVIGDEKGPDRFQLDHFELVSLERQRELGFELAALLPTRHYARKNLGYLLAFQTGAPVIYETDDDNAPLANWRPHPSSFAARQCSIRGWCNVYRFFTHEHIWPRGLPLDWINRPLPPDAADEVVRLLLDVQSPIQQSLVDHSPDVDAIWRLVSDRPFSFEGDGLPVWLGPGTWCPFNSQATWWFKPAYPLMYLPSHCAFRMTDIWRSLIAQRCLWAMGLGISFHAPDVRQDRNEHNLMHDFADEVSGYLRNAELARELESLQLESDPAALPENLRRCYRRTVEIGALPADELPLVEAWLADARRCGLG